MLHTENKRSALHIGGNQIAGDTNQSESLYSCLDVSVSIINDQRLFHTDCAVAIIQRKKPVGGTPGAVVQVANGVMSFQAVYVIRFTIGGNIVWRSQNTPPEVRERPCDQRR